MERHIFAAENSWNCGDERKTERRVCVEIVSVCVSLCLLHRVSAYMFVYIIYIELYVHTHLSIYTHTACFYLELMWSLGQMKCFRDPGESFRELTSGLYCYRIIEYRIIMES